MLHLNPFKHIFCINSIRISHFYVILLLLYSTINFSQVKNEDELKKQASAYFEDEDYNSSYKLYSQLVSLYPKDPVYNYRLGVCMLYTEPDKKKPFMYFQIALKIPNEDSKDAKFYLAKTYHVNYRFDEAIKLYTEYKQTASSSSIKKLQVDREIAACKNGKRLLSNLSDLVIISKKQLNEADYFRSYDIKDIGGKLLVKPDDFKTGYDKKKKDKSVVYLPRNGERVYFSSYGDGGSNGRDIYFVNRLPNGSWSKAQPMPAPINTEYDEDYPFLHPNGKTLYFSSKGHNSMGGYDVFKTTYNTETQSWSKPENLEFPINSPDDDILFVTDSLEKTAFFSTGRYSPYGKIDVLKISTERRPMNFAVLKGTVVKEDVTQSLLAKITVKNMANGEIIGTYKAQENGDYYMELPNGGKFIFTVETPGLTTQSDGVQMPIAYSLKPYKQLISYEKKVLKIINYFDGQIADENYSMMIDLIEKKAKLEVNENEPYNNNLKEVPKNVTNKATDKTNLNSVSTNNPTASGNDAAATKTNTNKNVTNEQLLSLAKMDAVEAENDSKILKQDAQEAFDLATQKTAEAVAIQKQVDEAAANLNAITNVAKKDEESVKINQLKEDAKTATAIANTATNLAKKLEVDADQKQKEADLTNQYIKELEIVTKNKNNKEALTKLEEIQTQLDAISKQPNQSDELVSSIKAELELKQNELKKSEKKNNEIVSDINSIKTESGTLETDLANENDKSLKENISAQIRELTTDIDTKNKELDANNQKIAGLKNQVDGLNKELEIAADILNENTSGAAITNNKGSATPLTGIDNTTGSNNTTGTNNSTGSEIKGTESTSPLSYEGITTKYDAEIKGKEIDKTNPKELTAQNGILKNYNKDIADLVSIDKNEASKTKDGVEKKKLNKEIKELENQKAINDKLITANTSALKKIGPDAIAGNNANPNTAGDNGNTTNPGNTNSGITTNTIDAVNASNTNTTSAISSSTNGFETNTTSVTNNTAQNNAAIEPINTFVANDNSAYLNELEKLKAGLNANTGAATQLFSYNGYKENSSLLLKQTADKKFETAKQNEIALNTLIASTETNIKANTGNKSTGLLNEADALGNKALEERKESVTKQGVEKDALLKQAQENEKLAVDKKLQASGELEKENKNKFDVNASNLVELQKLTGAKTSDDISQANMLTDEAAINYKQAQKLRTEANSYPAGAAKLGGLSNAEEKENEALTKQQKAIDILSKVNPSYKVKTPAGNNDPAGAITSLNNEINKTSQTQLDAYLALSKANQNELKLQGDKLAKNPAFNTEQNKPAQDLKNESDKLNKDAKAFIGQSLTTTGASEKANLLLMANEQEINALKKLNEAVTLLTNSGNTLAGNNTANGNVTTPENTQNTGNATQNTTNTNVSNNSGNTTASNTGSGNNNTSQNDNSNAVNNNTGADNKNGNAVKPETTSANNTNTSVTDAGNTNANTTNPANNAGNTAETGNPTTSATNSNTVIPSNNTTGDISSEIANLKNGLNNSTESGLTNFNTYTNTEAISLKEKASEKINAALNEDKNITASLDNAAQLALVVNGAQPVTQDAITNAVMEAEKTNDAAYELRKSAVAKTGEEKEKDLQQAKELETKAIAKKVEAAGNQQRLNSGTFEANTKSLEELAEMAKGKNISELSTADMQLNEATLYFNQAQKLREEANAYPTDAAKLGGFSNAEEKETLALNKQKAVLDVYKKYFSNYVSKQAKPQAANPEATAKLNSTKTSLASNNQAHIDGLLLLSQAVEKEYKSRLVNLPATLKTGDAALKTNAQGLYKKYQSALVQATKTTDVNKKKDFLIEANKNGQAAINALSQINTSGNAAVADNTGNTGLGNQTNNTTGNNTAGNNGNQTSGNNNTTGNNTQGNNTSTVKTNAGTSGNQVSGNNTVKNNNTVNNTGGNSNTPTVKLKVEGLEVKTNNAYTADKPIPIDEKIQDGLVFKVQVGAFKTTLPNNTFKGLSPVIAQTTPSGYIRYMAGNFEKYASANAVKNDLKNLGYGDAFVVAYYNGKRINLNEGVAKALEAGQAVDASTAANTSAGITANSNVPKNTFTNNTPNPTALPGDNQPVEITNELEKMNGLLYTVQIGVYSKQVTRSQLYNLRPIYTEKLPSGLYRYTAGIYNQTAKLLEDKRKVVDLGVKDAFVSAYYNAKRIAFAEGQKLQTENNNLKMETENPIIFSGATAPAIQNTTSNTPAVTPTTNGVTNTPNATAFNNGVTQSPIPTANNGVKADEAGISYKVQIGAYKNQVPNDVATKFMSIKTWPVNNVVINGLFIYTIGNFNAVSFAKKLKDEAVNIGVTDAFITVYKDGKKLYGAEASQYLNK